MRAERANPWDGTIVTETIWRVACRECSVEQSLCGMTNDGRVVRSQGQAASMAAEMGWKKVRGRGWTCPDHVTKSGKAG